MYVCVRAKIRLNHMGVLIVHGAENMCDGLRFEVKIKETNSGQEHIFFSVQKLKYNCLTKT